MGGRRLCRNVEADAEGLEDCGAGETDVEPEPDGDNKDVGSVAVGVLAGAGEREEEDGDEELIAAAFDSNIPSSQVSQSSLGDDWTRGCGIWAESCRPCSVFASNWSTDRGSPYSGGGRLSSVPFIVEPGEGQRRRQVVPGERLMVMLIV